MEEGSRLNMEHIERIEEMYDFKMGRNVFAIQILQKYKNIVNIDFHWKAHEY